MSDLQILSDSGPAILRLPEAIDKNSTEEDVLVMTAQIKSLATLARAVASQATEAMNEAWARWDAGEGKSVQTEDTRFYFGVTKRTKRVAAVRDILEYLLDATGGDLDSVAETLSSGAFKPGQLRKVIGDEPFAGMYSVEDVTDVKTGKPQKQLKAIPLNLPGVKA